MSPSWYEPGDLVATWNHLTAHLYGVPEILTDEENYQVLARLTDHFEQHYPGGRSLAEDEQSSRLTAKGTVGLRLDVARFDARAKLSQNKKPHVTERIISEFESRHPALAKEMRRVIGENEESTEDVARPTP